LIRQLLNKMLARLTALIKK